MGWGHGPRRRQARHSANSSFLARASASRPSGASCGAGRSISSMAVDDDAAHQGPQGVLVVRRHHVPWRPGAGGSRESFLVGGHVVVPVTALGQVGGRELPVLRRVVQAVEEPPLLLLLGDVQEDLHDPGAAAVEVALEGVDVRIALLPQRLGRLFGRDGPSSGQELRVHPDDEYLLVVGAVENADPAAFGERLGGPPQEVVAELLG